MLTEIKVGSFEWALLQLRKGERVRRSNWAPDYYCELAVSKILLAACNILDESYIFTIFSGESKIYGYTLNSDELTATDWELAKTNEAIVPKPGKNRFLSPSTAGEEKSKKEIFMSKKKRIENYTHYIRLIKKLYNCAKRQEEILSGFCNWRANNIPCSKGTNYCNGCPGMCIEPEINPEGFCSYIDAEGTLEALVEDMRMLNINTEESIEDSYRDRI